LRNDDGDNGKAADEIRKVFNDLTEASAEAVRQYAGLASSGQLASIVFKQLKHPVRQIRSDLDLALGDLDAGPIDADGVEDLKASLRAALQHLSTMEHRMERLDPLAMGGRGRRIFVVGLRTALEPVVEAFEDEFDR